MQCRPVQLLLRNGSERRQILGISSIGWKRDCSVQSDAAGPIVDAAEPIVVAKRIFAACLGMEKAKECRIAVTSRYRYKYYCIHGTVRTAMSRRVAQRTCHDGGRVSCPASRRHAGASVWPRAGARAQPPRREIAHCLGSQCADAESRRRRPVAVLVRCTRACSRSTPHCRPDPALPAMPTRAWRAYARPHLGWSRGLRLLQRRRRACCIEKRA